MRYWGCLIGWHPLAYAHRDDECPDPMYRYGDHSDYCPHGRRVCEHR